MGKWVCIRTDPQGELWIATHGGVSYCHGETFSPSFSRQDLVTPLPFEESFAFCV